MLTLRELKEEVLRRPVRGLILSGADGEICRKPERTRRILVHSVAKSVTAIGAGFALEEGYLSLDESVAEAFDMDLSKVESAVGNLRGEGAAKEHRKRLEKIRLTHLMSNTSGFGENYLTGFQRPYLTDDDWVTQCLSLPVTADAGSAFLYNDANWYLIAKLLQRRTGQRLTEYLLPRLFVPLGIRYPTWEVDPEGDIIGCGGLLLNLDELHRLGLVCLHNGVYGGGRVISGEWMKTAAEKKTDAPGGILDGSGYGYGYGFWTGPDYFSMFGLGGIYSFISRSGDLLITVDGLELT